MNSGGDKNSTFSKEIHKNRIVLKITTFNARTLLSEEKLVEMENEIKEINWDVVRISEVRRRGENLKILKSGYIVYYIEEKHQSRGSRLSDT